MRGPRLGFPNAGVSPGLDDIDGHGRRRGDQAADHTGAEMTQDVVTEVA